jgi:hypothetical protein
VLPDPRRLVPGVMIQIPAIDVLPVGTGGRR